MFDRFFTKYLQKKLRTEQGRAEILKATFQAIEQDYTENNYATNVYQWAGETLDAIPETVRKNTLVSSLYNAAIEERPECNELKSLHGRNQKQKAS